MSWMRGVKGRTRTGRFTALIAIAAWMLPACLAAQEPADEAPAPEAPPTEAAAEAPAAAPPAADPADVESIDAIMTAVYDVISGPAGEARDWDRFRSLFIPEARLIPSGRNQQGEHGYVVWSVEDYIATAGPSLEENGFFEAEEHRVTERWADIAHVFSTYNSYQTAADVEADAPFQRGINTFQLMYDGDRWWVVNIMWEGEAPTRPIPAEYLGEG